MSSRDPSPTFSPPPRQPLSPLARPGSPHVRPSNSPARRPGQLELGTGRPLPSHADADGMPPATAAGSAVPSINYSVPCDTCPAPRFKEPCGKPNGGALLAGFEVTQLRVGSWALYSCLEGVGLLVAGAQVATGEGGCCRLLLRGWEILGDGRLSTSDIPGG